MLDLGAEPAFRPIRKKAWYRALKRGALWAIVPFQHMKNGGMCLKLAPNTFTRVITDANCPSNTAYTMWLLENLNDKV